MPDIQISDPYTNKPTFYKYDSNDRQLLVDLLHEYSEKLMQISQALVLKNQKEIQKAMLYDSFDVRLNRLLIFLLVGITTLLLVGMLYLTYKYQYQLGLISKFNWQDIFGLSYLILCFGSAISLIVQVSKLTSKYTKQSNKIIILLKESAATTADKLEKVIQVTTEIQDRIEINLARKLELDLRISDAQSALEYYYSVTETKSNKSKKLYL